MKKMFLDNLPRKGGKFNKIDWQKSVGHIVRFTYDEIGGELEILSYDKKTEKLLIKYDKYKTLVNSTDFKNARISNVIKVRTSEYKIDIGKIFKDDKRDLVITDRERREDTRGRKWKWYKYTCNVCGWTEGWMTEGNLDGGKGCPCCAGKVVVEGINDIPTTAPWMVKYFQGGYDEAKLYTKSCTEKFYPICPECGQIKSYKITVNALNTNRNIGCVCSNDGFSYPEKFVSRLLELLNVNYVTQLSKGVFEWCECKRYDFYIPSLNMIIETHGLQHYKDVGGSWDDCEKQSENDRVKRELALKNGIEKYVVLDCRKSNLKWIKNSIIKSYLSECFNLTDIDWSECDLYAIEVNKIKLVCDAWNNKNELESTVYFAKQFCMDVTTIKRYLSKGSEYGWTIFDIEQCIEINKINSSNRNKERCSKPIKMFNENGMVGMHKSSAELERVGEKLYGIKFNHSKISLVCNNQRKHHWGFTFEYATKEEYEEYLNSQAIEKVV